ncbi:MAG: HEAT repeat domain-containing protein [Fimbriimonadales bacterium]
MKRKAVGLLVALVLVGVALGVRLMWQAPDAHELAHRKEAEAVLQIEQIKTLPPETQLERLLPMLEPSQPTEVRVSALGAIAELRPPNLLETLETAARDYHSAVRTRAAELAHTLPRETALGFLLNLAVDHDNQVRQVAIQKLSSLKDRRAVPTLIAMLEDSNPETVQMAMSALRSITGKNYYARYTAPESERKRALAQWREWWRTAKNDYPNTQPPQPYQSQTLLPAPNLTLRLLDGTQVNLSRPEKPLLLNHWGTWCAGCVEELPALKRLHETYGARLLMVGVAYDEPEGEQGLKRFCEQQGIRYPQMLANRAIEQAFHIHGVPQTMLIDTQGRIRYWWEGTRDYETFARAVEHLLQNP